MRRPEPHDVFSARPIVLVKGRRRSDVDAALMSMDLRIPCHGMAHVELRLLAAPVQGSFPFADLTHGSWLAVTYGSVRSAPIFEGEITAIELKMGDGPPELVILAEDALHRLARQMLPRSFTDKTADDVVQSLAQSAGLQCDANLGDSVETFVKGAESDLAFLLRLAAERGAALRLEQGRVFAGFEVIDPPPIEITANALRDLRIIADLNWKPGTVTVRGWDLAGNDEVQTPAAPLPQPPQLQNAATLVAELGWGANYVIPRDFSGASASAMIANAHAARAAERFLHGEIVSTERGLVPGTIFELSGTDPRFAGRYRVGDCRHRFSGANGLTVHARIARPTLQT